MNTYFAGTMKNDLCLKLISRKYSVFFVLYHSIHVERDFTTIHANRVKTTIKDQTSHAMDG